MRQGAVRWAKTTCGIVRVKARITEKKIPRPTKTVNVIQTDAVLLNNSVLVF